MSTIQLVDRSAGQVIQQNFWNDIHSALEGDFVGRDVNGQPVAGNNLGTPAYPWGTAYVDDLILGGVALTTSTLERPPYQIVSGRKRTGSNQPVFLVPAGSSPSFSLLAGTTNLILTINGIAVTWTADRGSIPVSTATSSGNTATVNDASATGQAATRTWGEYGSGAQGAGSPHYPITVSSMGAAISARVGTYQAFKVGTEYFIAFVESTTSLSRAFRGFFFDSTDAPIKRAAFSNGATITLMNLGWVFADQDGSTVDVIFVGAGVNNAPVSTYSAPASPATGDYWFDQGNQLWKRYNGTSWALVNRMPVGLVVADSTNCVAARSFDFFGLCRSDNTIDVSVSSNTVVKGRTLFQRINVNGRIVAFGGARPAWDTASNLAATSDRYNATVQPSSTEYLYVSDQGDTPISDIEPTWRPDLLGYYHPFNPWRFVVSVTTDASAHFQSTGVVPASWLPDKCVTTEKLVDASVTVAKLASNSHVSASLSGTSTSSSSGVTVGSTSFTASGLRPVLVLLQGTSTGSGGLIATSNTAQARAYVSISDGSTGNAYPVESLSASAVAVGTTAAIPICFGFIYFPTAGTRTYTVSLVDLSSGGVHSATIDASTLIIMEL
jgi:hypothetical protein